jgi:hypothetical protein
MHERTVDPTLSLARVGPEGSNAPHDVGVNDDFRRLRERITARNVRRLGDSRHHAVREESGTAPKHDDITDPRLRIETM